MIDNTLHLVGNSQRKQLKLTNWAVSAIKQDASESMTKGLVANEALLLANDDIEDSLTDIEAEVDRRLSEATQRNAPKIVAEIKKHDDLRSGLEYLRNRCEYANPDSREGTTDIYLLDHICDWLPARGAFETIEDALVHVASVPWNSRTERIRAKQQLARYAETGELAEDLHPVVEDIIKGESQTWDVKAAHQAIETPDNWWESSDLTPMDLYDRGEEIPQKPRDHRIRAIQTAVDNADSETTETFVMGIITGGIGVDEKTAERYYLPEISLGDDAVRVELVEKVLADVADDLRDEISRRGKKQLAKTDAVALGFERDILDLDRQYLTEQRAAEALQAIADGEYDRDDLETQSDTIQSHHKEAIKQISKRVKARDFKSQYQY